MSARDSRERHTRPYGGHSNDARLEFAKDYDHVLYSSAFRRLGGVTQVVGIDDSALFHNRMSHSLKVAQVGRRLTKKLLDKVQQSSNMWDVIERYGGGLDSGVVHAACIAHDLGRPPFGYVAERALNKILTAGAGESWPLPDSFDKSAQAFRIVNKLAFRESYGDGKSAALNLTRATLAALLKYPWPYSERRPVNADQERQVGRYAKWSYYDSEGEIRRFVQDLIVSRQVTRQNGKVEEERRTIEGQVMDWADDISYAIHDVEDFFRAGLIPLDDLAVSNDRFDEFFDDFAWPRVEPLFVGPTATDAARNAVRARAKDYLDQARNELPTRPYAGTRHDREDLHKFASVIIRNATDNTELTPDGLVKPSERDYVIIEVFKQLTWYYVVSNPAFASAQRGQVYVIRELFRDLTAWVLEEYPRSRKGNGSLPPRLREYVEIALDPDPSVGCVTYDEDEQKMWRAVADYICSLTERQAVQLAKRLHGTTHSPALGGWFQL